MMHWRAGTGTAISLVWGVLFSSVLSLSGCGGGQGAPAPNAGGAPSSSIVVLAGHMGGPGNVDGLGSAARFWSPGASTIDTSGNLYVADTYNHIIRKITPAGVVTTIAGIPGIAGSSDGLADRATFFGPGGLAFDQAGNLYVADDGNYTLRRLSPSGTVTTVAGTPGVFGWEDGNGAAAKFGDCFRSFGCPLPGIAVDPQGNVFYGDAANGVVRRITPEGLVTTFAGAIVGPADGRDGTGLDADFHRPSSIAIDDSGNLYVADGASVIRKITPAAVVSTLAGVHMQGGFVDGSGRAARFAGGLSGIAVDRSGSVFVTDTGNNAVRKVAPDGTVTTLAGTNWAGSADGRGPDARFWAPAGVAVDRSGVLFVSDTAHHTMRRIGTDVTVTTFAGLAAQEQPRDGIGIEARFGLPVGAAVASSGDLLVADNSGHAIRKVTLEGTTSTFAGRLGAFGSDNGTGQSALFYYPSGIAVSRAGDAYVADSFNHRIRKISPEGKVTTFAGSGDLGHEDGSALDARFNFPMGVAVDASGNVYVADTGNHTIRKIVPSGAVSTLAGIPLAAGAADGAAHAAMFYRPWDLAVDGAGNVFVADEMNHAVRKITPAGSVSTFAGTLGVAGWRDGIGSSAGFYRPEGITVDSEGNLYVADSWNHTIRKITTEGIVRTVVGSAGYRGFAGDQLPGVLSFPFKVAVSGSAMFVTTAQGVVVLSNRP